MHRGTTVLLIAFDLVAVASGCSRRTEESAKPSLTVVSWPLDVDYAEARKSFRTRLVRTSPSPQQAGPLHTPPGARAVTYQSGELSLTAYMDLAPKDGKKHPAVLFCHGGFAFGDDDWSMPQLFRDAGFVVMVPILRGENGQPGNYSTMYDEVDDVLAAAETLAHLPEVDADRVYVSGHSVGGTLALLAAMTTTRFRAAASLSATVDQRQFVRSQPDLVAYDSTAPHEIEMRSPLAFATSLHCQTRISYGEAEEWTARPSKALARFAEAKHLDVQAVSVPGDHFSSVPAEIRAAIAFFETH